jgi:hypothetical protein
VEIRVRSSRVDTVALFGVLWSGMRVSTGGGGVAIGILLIKEIGELRVGLFLGLGLGEWFTRLDAE